LQNNDLSKCLESPSNAVLKVLKVEGRGANVSVLEGDKIEHPRVTNLTVSNFLTARTWTQSASLFLVLPSSPVARNALVCLLQHCTLALTKTFCTIEPNLTSFFRQAGVQLVFPVLLTWIRFLTTSIVPCKSLPCMKHFSALAC
jgi:hypothetical protein